MIRNLKLTKTDKVLNCPFCGGEPELRNTHTACYWVECRDCEAQATGRAHGKDCNSDDLTLEQHKLAKTSAIYWWNKRV